MLEHLLVSHIFAFFITFARMGSCLMLLPGFGEIYVSMWVRLGIALSVSLIMMPMVHAMDLPMPSSAIAMTGILMAETTIGVFIAVLCRIILSALHSVGTMISMQSGLAAAMMFDVSQASQGTVIGNMLSMTGIILWMALDFHHLMFESIYQSYGLFSIGHLPIAQDMMNTVARTLSASFTIAVQLSAPIVVVTMLVNLGGGILARLMPTIQVFFLLMPAQILFTFFLLSTILGGMYLWYLQYAQDALTYLLAPPGF